MRENIDAHLSLFLSYHNWAHRPKEQDFHRDTLFGEVISPHEADLCLPFIHPRITQCVV